MNKIFNLVFVGIFLISVVSAGVSVVEGPEEVYNFGDHVGFIIKISPNGYFENLLVLKMVCGVNEVEVYREFIITETEIQKEIKIPLVKSFIGESKGSCEIRSIVSGSEETISDKFKISDFIKIEPSYLERSVLPGEILQVMGNAVKENGEGVEGVVEINSSFGDSNIFKSGVVENGNFNLTVSVPEKYRAGEQSLGFYVYEKDKKGNIVNEGKIFDKFHVKQVATNLEIFLEEKNIVPGKDLSFTVFLRDQTGEKMDSEVFVAIKDENDEIIERIETETGVENNYWISGNESPSTWSISVYAEEIINSVDLEILENKKINFDLVNETLIVENVGNVLYNESLNVTIGDKLIEIPIYLDVGEDDKYSISAPNGEYEVSVGDFHQRALLTGNAVNVKRISDFNLSYIKIIAWIFIILILGFVAHVIFKKGYKKTFFGRTRKRKKEKVLSKKGESISKTGMINPKVKTELSLSITGTKQNAIVGCISLKNYEAIKSGEGNVRETFEKIDHFIESHKGLIYKNNHHLFFILAPVLTKTFNNEGMALEIANVIVKEMKVHNKKFKKKIDFGISLNYGTIVTKIGVHSNQFMSMGTLMTDAKKMANVSNGEIYLGEKVREKLGSKVKVELKQVGSLKAWEVKELNSGKKDYSPFLKGFMERQQKERIAKENHKKKKEREKAENINSEDKKVEDSVEEFVGEED